jgi:hypothetical protein
VQRSGEFHRIHMRYARGGACIEVVPIQLYSLNLCMRLSRESGESFHVRDIGSIVRVWFHCNDHWIKIDRWGDWFRSTYGKTELSRSTHTGGDTDNPICRCPSNRFMIPIQMTSIIFIVWLYWGSPPTVERGAGVGRIETNDRHLAIERQRQINPSFG